MEIYGGYTDQVRILVADAETQRIVLGLHFAQASRGDQSDRRELQLGLEEQLLEQAQRARGAAYDPTKKIRFGAKTPFPQRPFQSSTISRFKLWERSNDEAKVRLSGEDHRKSPHPFTSLLSRPTLKPPHV